MRLVRLASGAGNISATAKAVAQGIEAIGREEAAYWLGMAVHRKHPRRVLAALRFLLTEPRR